MDHAWSIGCRLICTKDTYLFLSHAGQPTSEEVKQPGRDGLVHVAVLSADGDKNVFRLLDFSGGSIYQYGDHFSSSSTSRWQSRGDLELMWTSNSTTSTRKRTCKIWMRCCHFLHIAYGRETYSSMNCMQPPRPLIIRWTLGNMVLCFQ